MSRFISLDTIRSTAAFLKKNRTDDKTKNEINVVVPLFKEIWIKYAAVMVVSAWARFNTSMLRERSMKFAIREFTAQS